MLKLLKEILEELSSVINLLETEISYLDVKESLHESIALTELYCAFNRIKTAIKILE